MAHTSPYLFFLFSNCIYNSHIIKNENFLEYFMRILNSCVILKFQTVNPGRPPSQPHTFWLTAVRRDIRAALYFYSCELRWRSTECVLLLPCFNALTDIFAVINCCLRIPLIIYVHYSDKLQPTTTSKESVCRIICTGMPEGGSMTGASIPLSFQNGNNGDGGAFSS